MFARVIILPGTEILREEPLLPFGGDGGLQILLEAAFTTLSEFEQTRLMLLGTLCNCGEEPCEELPLKLVWNANACRVLREEDTP